MPANGLNVFELENLLLNMGLNKDAPSVPKKRLSAGKFWLSSAPAIEILIESRYGIVKVLFFNLDVAKLLWSNSLLK